LRSASSRRRAGLGERLRRFRALQARLARKVITADCLPGPPRRVAGFDLAFPRRGIAVAAAAVFANGRLVESRHRLARLTVPYVPTFLGLREGPAIIRMYKELEQKPDVIMVNGHGLAHPFRCGLATYVGIRLGVPSIGVAAGRLTGHYEEVPREAGAWTPLRDRGETIGAVVRTRQGSPPIYVSIGHMTSLPTAVAIVMDHVRDGRLPQPLLEADRLAHRVAKGLTRAGRPRP